MTRFSLSITAINNIVNVGRNYKGQKIEPWSIPICLDLMKVSESGSKRQNVRGLIGSH